MALRPGGGRGGGVGMWGCGGVGSRGDGSSYVTIRVVSWLCPGHQVAAAALAPQGWASCVSAPVPQLEGTCPQGAGG